MKKYVKLSDVRNSSCTVNHLRKTDLVHTNGGKLVRIEKPIIVHPCYGIGLWDEIRIFTTA